MADSAAMDVDSSGEAQPPKAKFAMNVLHVIKTSQAQHGGRYGDYQRYRRYCTTRLRRLYHSLKFLHGRGKYQKKNIETATISEARYLHISLYSAERAWAYAMQLKAEVAEKGTAAGSSRLQAHMLKRLRRAALWGDVFKRMCALHGDSRTALEAEAYSSYLRGSLLMEKETDLDAAMKKFLRTKTVYEQLGRVGDVEMQVLCRQRAEEMEPSIRFCRYKMGGEGGGGGEAASLLQISSSQEGPAADLLQSKLQAVLEEARTKEAANLAELAWLGRKLPISNAKTRVLILKAQQLESEVKSADLPNERRLNLYDKIFAAYHDAKRTIRDDMAAAGNEDDVKEPLTALDRAVGCIILDRTIERNLVLVAGAKARLEKQQQQQHQVAGRQGGQLGAGEGRPGSKKKAAGQPVLQEEEKERERAARPEDLVRLFDTLLQNVSDLADLVGSGREAREEEKTLIEQLQAKSAAYQAARCLYLGQAFAGAGRTAEAYAVLGLAVSEADAALAAVNKVKSKQNQSDLTSSLTDLEAAKAKARALRCQLAAKSALEAAKASDPSAVEKGVADMALKEKEKGQTDGPFLTESTSEFVSALAPLGSKLPSRIARVPPLFQAVPCRPIVLDTALNAITFPSLDSRIKKEGKKSGGLFSAFWGAK